LNFVKIRSRVEDEVYKISEFFALNYSTWVIHLNQNRKNERSAEAFSSFNETKTIQPRLLQLT